MPERCNQDLVHCGNWTNWFLSSDVDTESLDLFLTGSGTTSQKKWCLQSRWRNFDPSPRLNIKCSHSFSVDINARLGHGPSRRNHQGQDQDQFCLVELLFSAQKNPFSVNSTVQDKNNNSKKYNNNQKTNPTSPSQIHTLLSRLHVAIRLPVRAQVTALTSFS